MGSPNLNTFLRFGDWQPFALYFSADLARVRLEREPAARIRWRLGEFGWQIAGVEHCVLSGLRDVVLPTPRVVLNRAPYNKRSAELAKNGKVIRRKWTTEDVRDLKVLAKQKLGAEKIAKKLKRTKSATIAKAFTLGVSLETQG
jgi:hypothetical protein